MIQYLLETVANLGVSRTVVIVGKGAEAVTRAVKPHKTVLQAKQLGTGHAVLQARETLRESAGDILILFGADPLITVETLSCLLSRRHEPDKPAIVVLGFRPEYPNLYGRLQLNDAGMVESIVEASDATPEQLKIQLCNSGVMCVDSSILFNLLDRVTSHNAKKEFYLTDIIAIARQDGLPTAVIEGGTTELIGIDDRVTLARGEAILQDRLRAHAMAQGVTLQDPKTVYFSYDTKLGHDVKVGPNVVFGPGVTIGNHVTVQAFCHIEGATVADGAIIGPFARLRPGTHLAEEVHIGNFVEIKNAHFDRGAKANHLTYVGDAQVGKHANIGAGTITCNYDGLLKHKTEIGSSAFIGSNTALVAPVKVGDRAITGAGSTITNDIQADALAVTRVPQRNIDGWAKKFRPQKSAKISKKRKN